MLLCAMAAPASPIDPVDAQATKKARDAALSSIAEVENEARMVAKERGAAVAHIQATLDRVAAARAATGLSPPPSNLPPKDPKAPPQHDLHDTMLLHEAAAILNLHAQAISITNIQSFILTMLDINSGNYARWRDQFLLTAGKFSLQDHVLLDTQAPDSPYWTRMDYVCKF